MELRGGGKGGGINNHLVDTSLYLEVNGVRCRQLLFDLLVIAVRIFNANSFSEM